MISQRSGKAIDLVLTNLFNAVLEVLITAIRQEKEINITQMKKKEKKYFLFSDNMTVYAENPQDVQCNKTTKYNKWIQQRHKYKINTKEKNSHFLHTNNAYIETKI